METDKEIKLGVLKDDGEGVLVGGLDEDLDELDDVLVVELAEQPDLADGGERQLLVLGRLELLDGVVRRAVVLLVAAHDLAGLQHEAERAGADGEVGLVLGVGAAVVAGPGGGARARGVGLVRAAHVAQVVARARGHHVLLCVSHLGSERKGTGKTSQSLKPETRVFLFFSMLKVRVLAMVCVRVCHRRRWRLWWLLWLSRDDSRCGERLLLWLLLWRR